jgi:multisubunit Na+/H+ antiporter MnhB subunit
MAFGFTAILICVAIVAILILVRIKKLKHELFAIFLIAVILFGVFSFSLAFKGKDVSISDMPSLEKAVKIYFSWFGNAVNNAKVITGQIVKMNWQGNKTT